MKLETRLFLAILLGLLADFCSHLFLFPFLGEAQSNTGLRYLLSIATVVVVGIVIWKATANLTREHAALVIKGGSIGVLIGFLIGFVGPIVLRPYSPQGPLLGIFFTIPIGLIIGLIAGFFYVNRKYRNF